MINVDKLNNIQKVKELVIIFRLTDFYDMKKKDVWYLRADNASATWLESFLLSNQKGI